MLAGAVPVVADVGDLSELVYNGETGYRLTAGDTAQYAHRIYSLLTDDPTWRQMSLAARQRARENNSMECITARWESVIRTLFRSPEAGPVGPAPVTTSGQGV